MNDKIFALDIGTRSIVGLVADYRKDVLYIVDCEIREYASRAMFDGQIHDIDAVAAVIADIKKSLERRMGIELRQAGIALAGRKLMTQRYRLEQNITRTRILDSEAVKNIELQAVTELFREINDKTPEFNRHYQCVGYSVVRYELDGVIIHRLDGHAGNMVSVDLLATFLPRTVMDSVLSALHKADLEPCNITLEPIAAVTAIIPADMRKLNLALIDIGAGTSDIAITSDGSIIAYGMVPYAGDKITEKISDSYLLDFNVAETVKRTITPDFDMVVQNIFGLDVHLGYADVIAKIQPEIRILAELAAKEVLKLNERPPRGVILVGGGSLVPTLSEHIHDLLELSDSAIGFRQPDSIKGVMDETKQLNTCEFVTPIGILLTTARDMGLKFVRTEINGRRYQIPNIHNRIQAALALSFIGMDMSSAQMPQSKNLGFELNGIKKVIPGLVPKPTEILINGTAATLDSYIQDGDQVTIKESVYLDNPPVSIQYLIEKLPPIVITCNGRKFHMTPTCLKNGKEVLPEETIDEGSRIDIKAHTYPYLVLAKMEVDVDQLFKEIHVQLNGENKVLRLSEFTLTRNGEAIRLDSPIFSGDDVVFNRKSQIAYKIKDVLNLESKSDMKIQLNDQPLIIPNSDFKVLLNGKPVNENAPVFDGAEISTHKTDNQVKVLSHLFKYLSLKPMDNAGKNLVMKVNGQSAGFTTPIEDGSDVVIVWEDQPS